MSKRRQQQPTSQHSITGSEQASQGPVTEDAGVAHAEQVGNGAAQEEMQGQEEGESEAEGALDWVVDKGKELVGDVVEAVEDWGLEQLTSVEAILEYVDVVGIDVAMQLLVQVSQDLVEDLVEELAKGEVRRDLLWTLLDWLKTAVFLPALTSEQVAKLLIEALRDHQDWMLDELAELGSDTLLQVVQLLDSVTLDAVIDAANNLSRAITDAVWPPGVGVTISESGAAVIAVVAVGESYSGTLRHEGGGVLTGAFEVTGSAGLETGVGESAKAGPKKEGGEATLYCMASGTVAVELRAADAASWDGARLVGAVAGGMAIAPALDMMLGTQAFPVAEMIEKLTISGEVNAGGKANLDIPDLAGVAANAGQKIGAAAVQVTHMQGTGDFPSRGTFEFEFSSGAYAKVAGTSVEIANNNDKAASRSVTLPLPQLETELSGDIGVRVRATVDLEKMTANDIELEAFVKGKALGVEAEAALQGEFMDAYTVQGFLDSFEALKVLTTIDLCGAPAESLLEDSPLQALTLAQGLAVQGQLELKATLDRDTTRFLAETIAGGTQDEKEALERLQAWVRDPFGPALGEARQLLCMELAQATHLEAKLASKIEILTEAGFKVAEGMELGVDLSLGVKLDYEADLMKEGAAPTASDFDHILSELQGDAEAAQAAK